MSDLLTTNQAARELGVSVSRVHQYRRDGDLEPVPGTGGKGQRYYYTIEAVQACARIDRTPGWPKGRPRKEL